MGISQSKVIYYVPVEKRFFSKWEYYQVDYDVLSLLFSEVIVCSTFMQFLKSFWRADLIFCWWWHTSAPVVLLAKIFHIKVHVTGAIHMFDLSGAVDYYSKRSLFRLAAKISLALADKNLFISYDQLDQINSHLVVNNPVVIRSSLTKDFGFSKDLILAERNRQKSIAGESDEVVFLTVVWHRLDQYKRKGVFETLNALKTIKEKTAFSFKWIIVGGMGDGIDILRSTISELGLEGYVSVKTDVSVEDKRSLFLTADLYLQPSWCEGFGNAVLEAMSNGLPALVSRYTAQPEVVGSTGFVVMEMTSECIYDQLRDFFDLSDMQKTEMTESVLDRVEKEFSFSHRVDCMAELFSDSGINFKK